jgi:hypothetical protein
VGRERAVITVGYRNLPDGGRAWSVKRPGLSDWRLTDDEAQELSATLLLMLAEARNEDTEDALNMAASSCAESACDRVEPF